MILVFVRKTTQKPCSHIRLLRWILKILHDPKYLLPWELSYSSILRSCRIFVSTVGPLGLLGLLGLLRFWIGLLQPFLL